MATLAAAIPPKPEPLKNSIKVGSQFSPKKMRSLDNYDLEIGDEFTIPETFEVLSGKIGDQTVEYIEVKLTNGKTKPLYPSVFTKFRTVYNEDGTSTGKRKWTKGSAADLFRKQEDTYKGMESLKGKTLRVTDIEYVPTLRFGTTVLTKSQIPTIDIIE